MMNTMTRIPRNNPKIPTMPVARCSPSKHLRLVSSTQTLYPDAVTYLWFTLRSDSSSALMQFTVRRSSRVISMYEKWTVTMEITITHVNQDRWPSLRRALSKTLDRRRSVNCTGTQKRVKSTTNVNSTIRGDKIRNQMAEIDRWTLPPLGKLHSNGTSIDSEANPTKPAKITLYSVLRSSVLLTLYW